MKQRPIIASYMNLSMKRGLLCIIDLNALKFAIYNNSLMQPALPNLHVTAINSSTVEDMCPS